MVDLANKRSAGLSLYTAKGYEAITLRRMQTINGRKCLPWLVTDHALSGIGLCRRCSLSVDKSKLANINALQTRHLQSMSLCRRGTAIHLLRSTFLKDSPLFSQNLFRISAPFKNDSFH